MEQLSLDVKTAPAVAPTSTDAELLRVHAAIRTLDPEGRRFAAVLRRTIDQLLNGEDTGRYDWNDLMKTEKTHAGTVVEINLQREFQFADGEKMDYSIAGIDVDCKFSQTFGGWMIPPEADRHLCLLVWADDRQSKWSAGLVRITQDVLNNGGNRDKKATIKADSRVQIVWLWQDSDLPENILLHLEKSTRDKILSHKNGQPRVTELFRLVHGRRIGRGVVRTVARQVDYMARIREGDNNRSRPKLRSEGIIILGDYPVHQRIAEALGGPVPEEGEFVAHRLVRYRPEDGERPHALIEGEEWAVARLGETPEIPAPKLPNPQPSQAIL
ncbi:NaeI family type II restriction endonuclease [Nocardia niigatensis]